MPSEHFADTEIHRDALYRQNGSMGELREVSRHSFVKFHLARAIEIEPELREDQGRRC